MSPREIVHRAVELLCKIYLSLRPIVSDLKIQLPKIRWETLPVEMIANKVECRHGELFPLEIFGIQLSKSDGKIYWQEFPSGVDSSNFLSFKIKYREQSTLENDIRIAWELNRLNWLLPYAFDSNQDCRKASFRLFKDFLITDRPGYGIRWNSMIELSLQSISLILLSSIFEEFLNSELRSKLNQAICNRYRWIKLLPSRHSSSNNHRIAELVSLTLMAELMNNRAESLKHQKELIEQVRKQTGKDGFNLEASSNYHLFVLDLLLTLQFVYPNLEIHDELKSFTTAMASSVQDFLNSFQVWPKFGDSDEARVLSGLVDKDMQAISLINLAGEIQHKAARPITSFDDVGYTVARSDGGEGDLSLLLDHGSLGLAPIYAHAHADSLAIWLVYRKKEILVEAGTYSYHSNSNLRNFLRSGWAHNTVTIDGQSLSKPSGPFLWKRKHATKSKLISASISSRNEVTLHAVANYAKSRQYRDGELTRTIKLASDSIELVDEITSGMNLQVHFVLAEDFELEYSNSVNSCSFKSTDGTRINFSSSSGGSIQIYRIPISPTYGVLKETYKLVIQNEKRSQVIIRLSQVKEK